MKQTLKQLVERFRADATDEVEPHLFSTEFVKEALNDAEHEAAIRARLLHESDDERVCVIDLVPGKSAYRLHDSLYELTHIMRIEDGKHPVQLEIKSVEWLNKEYPDWRTDHKYVLPYLVQTDTGLRLATPPTAAGQLRIEGYRLPLRAMCSDNHTPEIHTAHHDKLVLWALHRAFSQPDADGFDPQRAEKALAKFTEYFGLRPDADLRRETREDEPVNVSYI